MCFCYDVLFIQSCFSVANTLLKQFHVMPFVYICSVAFIVGVLVYLFIGPPECLDKDGNGEDVPPLLYGSLFAFVIILFLSILNENIIFSISIKGNIIDQKNKRKYLVYWLFLRVGLVVVETLCIIVCTFAVFSPAPYAAGALVCAEYQDGPLVFARVVVVLMLVTLSVYIAGFLVFVDPLGICCAPSTLKDMRRTHEYASLTQKQVEQAERELAKSERLGGLHGSRFGYWDSLKKIQSALCCLNVNGNRSRQTAMREMAKAIQTLFHSGEERVPSDLVAGIILVSRYQKAQRESCNCKKTNSHCLCAVSGLKKVRLLLNLPECVGGRVEVFATALTGSTCVKLD